ncbi:MAG: TolC family protein [Candidatus Omnitrophica bacterium]|nr:TolC family protein [Candidatus Omnitrophota bacterium]
MLVSTASFVFAQEMSPADELAQLVQVLRRQNPELAALRERISASGYRVSQAKAFEAPVIGADIEGIPKRDFSFNKYMDVEYMVMQELPGPGKRRLRGEIAEKGVALLEKEYAGRELDMILELKQFYYQLYFLERAIEINQENQELLRQMGEIAEAKYSTGQTAQQDVIKAQVELAKLVNGAILLDQGKKIALARINTLLARGMEEPVWPPKALQLHLPAVDWDIAVGQMLEKSPELKSSQLAAEQAETEMKLARKEFFPDFQVRSEARHFKGEGGIREVDTFLGMNLPFWFWTDKRAVLKEKKGEWQASKSSYQSSRNQALFQLQQAWIEMEAKQRIAELFETTLVPQARQVMESARAGYQTNKIDFLNWIDAQRFLQEISLEKEQSVVEFHQGIAWLERAVGGELPVEVEGQGSKVEGQRSKVEGKTNSAGPEKGSES